MLGIKSLGILFDAFSEKVTLEDWLGIVAVMMIGCFAVVAALAFMGKFDV